MIACIDINRSDERRGGIIMDALDVVVSISLLLFDICCIMYIKKELIYGTVDLIKKVEKALEDDRR